MKNKFAIWSWVLPVSSFIIYFLITEISYTNVGGIIEMFITQRSIIRAVVIFSSTFLSVIVVGFYLALTGLRKMDKNPGLSGRTHARVGIVLNILLFIFVLLRLSNDLAICWFLE